MKQPLAIVFSVLTLAGTQAYANLVLNPGFEIGFFTDWTESRMEVASSPHSGTEAGMSQPGDATLSQAISTTPGSEYDITFWLSLSSYEPPQPTTFSAAWGGTTEFSITPTFNFGYTEETIHNVTATTASTILFFDLNTDGGEFFIDDVSVVDVTPAGVPDGGWTAALLGVGFAALGFFKIRLCSQT